MRSSMTGNCFSENSENKPAYLGDNLTDDERKGLEASGYVPTGTSNIHGQPLLRNKYTGEVLSLCRGIAIQTTCFVRKLPLLPDTFRNKE